MDEPYLTYRNGSRVIFSQLPINDLYAIVNVSPTVAWHNHDVGVPDIMNIQRSIAARLIQERS